MRLAPVSERAITFALVARFGPWATSAGANQFGQLGSDAVPPDADHNMYKAMMKWVEQGVAPEKLIATKFADDDPSSPVLRTRLLCEYPMLGKYNGSGSTDDAANFSCAQP